MEQLYSGGSHLIRLFNNDIQKQTYEPEILAADVLR